MPGKVILFVGAPSASSVSPQACTLTEIDGVFDRLIGRREVHRIDHALGYPSSAGISHPAWRSLSLKRQPLHTGFTQFHHVDDDSLWDHRKFFTTADMTIQDETGSFDEEAAETILSQFCQHSLAAHDQASIENVESFDDSVSDETSFMTTASAERLEAGFQERHTVPLHLSDLEDIPLAHQVTSLVPQTITVNLIVGVISIAQPRTVMTRWGKTMSLVEILVGDETATGFGVTFWLDSQEPKRAAIESLRRQDVVLMQNVALHVFRGKVYGQSLRRGLTKIELLWRRDGSGFYTSRALTKVDPKNHPQRHKSSLVKDWVLRFVGADTASTKSKAAKRTWDMPPDDTQ